MKTCREVPDFMTVPSVNFVTFVIFHYLGFRTNCYLEDIYDSKIKSI